MTAEQVREFVAAREGESWDEWVDEVDGVGLVTLCGEQAVLLSEGGGGMWALHDPDGVAAEVGDLATLRAALDRIAA